MWVLPSFILRLRKPYTITKRSVWDILVIWCIFYALAIIIGWLLNIILSKFGITPNPNILQDFIVENNTRKVLMIVVLLWPLLEELIFRMPQKYHIWNLSILLGGICYIVFSLLSHYQLSDYLYVSQDFNILISIWIILLIWVIFRYMLWWWEDKLSWLWIKYSRWIIFISTLLFGLMHISNFGEWLDRRYLIWLMVIPQFILWYMLSYVRWSRWWTMWWIIHSLHNLVSFLPILLFKQILWPDTNLLFDNPQKIMEVIDIYPQIGVYGSIIWFVFLLILSTAIYGMIDRVKSSSED